MLYPNESEPHCGRPGNGRPAVPMEVAVQAQALELSREEWLCSEAPAPREAVTSIPSVL